MIVTHEDRTTKWTPLWFDSPRYDGVRIWLRKTPFGYFQRHEWRLLDGSTHLDAWIPSCAKPSAPWPSNYQRPPEPAEDDESTLVLALQAIAEGHNDPRTLAANTLSALRIST